MTKSDNEKLLLSLQEEVQALKNLLGGVLTNLESRVCILEQKKATIPNYTQPITDWEFGSGKKDGLIVPGWNGTSVIRGEKYSIPADGWLECVIHVENIIKDSPREWGDSEVQFSIDTLTMARCMLYCGCTTHALDTVSCVLPVKAGSTFNFYANSKTPNAVKNNAWVRLFANS